MEGRLNNIKNGGIKGMYGEDVSGYEVYEHATPFKFKVGGVLPKLSIAYETWGELNTQRNNAVLIQTGLSGSSHAKSSKVLQRPDDHICVTMGFCLVENTQQRMVGENDWTGSSN